MTGDTTLSTFHGIEANTIQTKEGLVRAGGLPEAERPQPLPAPLRLLMDNLRLIAFRAETATATVVWPERDNPDTARSPLKSTFPANAKPYPDEQAGTLTV